MHTPNPIKGPHVFLICGSADSNKIAVLNELVANSQNRIRLIRPNEPPDWSKPALAVGEDWPPQAVVALEYQAAARHKTLLVAAASPKSIPFRHEPAVLNVQQETTPQVFAYRGDIIQHPLTRFTN